MFRYGPEGTVLQRDSGLSLEALWYLAVTCSACLAGGTQELDFLGDDFNDVSVFSAMLGFDGFIAHASDYGGSGVEVDALAVDTGSGMCFAGLLVVIYLALCSLWLESVTCFVPSCWRQLELPTRREPRGGGKRRLRQWLRHERLNVAMALAENNHHTDDGKGRGGGSRDALHGHVPDASPSPGGRHPVRG